MSLDDFCACTFDEFEAICKAWQEMAQGRERGAWERARTVAAISIQPHISKKITPRQLLPFPWDRAKAEHKSESAPLSAEEKRKRFEEIARRLGDEINH